MLPNQLQDLILEQLPNAIVIAESNDNVHFTLRVVSEDFGDKSLLERQRLINNIVKQQIQDGTLHALSLKTYTNAEWQRTKEY